MSLPCSKSLDPSFFSLSVSESDSTSFFSSSTVLFWMLFPSSSSSLSLAFSLTFGPPLLSLPPSPFSLFLLLPSSSLTALTLFLLLVLLLSSTFSSSELSSAGSSFAFSESFWLSYRKLLKYPISPTQSSNNLPLLHTLRPRNPGHFPCLVPSSLLKGG